MNATAEIPTPVSSPTASAEELVHSMPPEEKEAVLMLLLKELIEINGGEGMILLNMETEDLGIYLPPKAAAALFERPGGPELTPEQEIEMAARMSRLDQGSIPIEQAIEELRQKEMALRAEMAQQSRV